MAGDWLHYTLCYRRDHWSTFSVLALAQMIRSKKETGFLLIFKMVTKLAQFSFLQFKTLGIFLYQVLGFSSLLEYISQSKGITNYVIQVISKAHDSSPALHKRSSVS